MPAFTPRSRAVAALYHHIPDRVPCVPLIDNSYSARALDVPVSACFLDPLRHAESLAACLELHPLIDGLSINLGLSKDVILEQRQTSDGYLVKTTGGMTWYIPYNDIGSVLEREITSFDDPRLDVEDGLKWGILRTLEAMPTEIRERFLINVGVTGPFSQLVFMMGLDRIMLATIDDPAGLHRAIEKRLPLALQWIEEMAALDPACIWIGEGVASASLISPATYREFVLPSEQVLADKIRQIGVPSLLHICGKLAPTLHLIPEARVDGLELDWPVPMQMAKAQIGDRVSLKGNLNTTTLIKADPEEIYNLSKELIEIAGPGGGFILSSGCALGRDTPPANVDAMAQAAIDFGQYPPGADLP